MLTCAVEFPDSHNYPNKRFEKIRANGREQGGIVSEGVDA